MRRFRRSKSVTGVTRGGGGTFTKARLSKGGLNIVKLKTVKILITGMTARLKVRICKCSPCISMSST